MAARHLRDRSATLPPCPLPDVGRELFQVNGLDELIAMGLECSNAGCITT